MCVPSWSSRLSANGWPFGKGRLLVRSRLAHQLRAIVPAPAQTYGSFDGAIGRCRSSGVQRPLEPVGCMRGLGSNDVLALHHATGECPSLNVFQPDVPSERTKKRNPVS